MLVSGSSHWELRCTGAVVNHSMHAKTSTYATKVHARLKAEMLGPQLHAVSCADTCTADSRQDLNLHVHCG